MAGPAPRGPSHARGGRPPGAAPGAPVAPGKSLIRIAVWASDPESQVAWRCDRCPTELRRQRGLCGQRDFSPSLSGARRDDRGRPFVEASRVAPGSPSEDEPVRFYRCPIADTTRGGLAALVRTWRGLQVEGVGLADLHPRPTEGLVEGLIALDAEVGELRRVQQERALEAARRKGGRHGG